MSVLLSDIFARIRRRCDFVNSTFLSDSLDLLPWFNTSHRELYELLVTTYGPPYFLAMQDITLSSTQGFEMTGVYKLLRVDTAFDGVRVPMRPFQLSTEVLRDTEETWGAGTDIRYHFEGSSSNSPPTNFPSLRFTPRPTGTHLVRVYYVPACQVFDSFSVESVSGPVELWDEYIVVDCAIKAKIKADEDASPLLLAKAEMKQRVMDSAPARDAGQATVVADVQSLDGNVAPDWWW